MRLLEIIRKWLWARFQKTIWSTRASEDQLKQIIWRLEMNESSCPPDTRAALALARQLYKRVYGLGGRI